MAQVNNWEAKRNHVNSLVAELQKKPESEKLAYPLNPAGILNAYREGDVLFEDAVSQLREWAIKYAAQHGVHADGLIAGANCPDCGCGFRDPHNPDCKYARR